MPEDSLESKIRPLVRAAKLRAIADLLSTFNDNGFDMLIAEINSILSDKMQEIISEAEWFLRRNKLFKSILEQVIEFDKKQSQQQTANITNQKTQVKSIALPTENYWQVIEDEFIHNLEKYLYMNPQSRSEKSETGVRIFTYYFLEEQLEYYTACTKTLEQLNPAKGGYETELARLLRTLNDASRDLGKVLDESNNKDSDIRSELQYIYERSSAMRTKLLESIHNNQARKMLNSIEQVDKPQLLICLRRLVSQLEGKKAMTIGFSRN